MGSTSIYVCVVDGPEGTRHYVTLIPPETAFSQGLCGEAIVGLLVRPLEAGERITPQVFTPNPAFARFLHSIVAEHAPRQAGCREEARRQVDGWIYIVDQRTPDTNGELPLEDIIGRLEVRGGEVVPGSYQLNSHHLLLSQTGFFQLDEEIGQALVRELEARNSRG
jgi:hypothetical protein